MTLSPRNVEIPKPYIWLQGVSSGAVRQGRIASSTAAVYISVIRRFYVFLGKCGELAASSFFTLVEKVVDGRRKVISSDLAIRITSTTKRTINPLNDAEVHILDEALKSESGLFSLMIVLMKNCGLRLDEMLTLPSSLFTEEYLASVPVSELTIRGFILVRDAEFIRSLG